jgi:hypothetical protein
MKILTSTSCRTATIRQRRRPRYGSWVGRTASLTGTIVISRCRALLRPSSPAIDGRRPVVLVSVMSTTTTTLSTVAVDRSTVYTDDRRQCNKSYCGPIHYSSTPAIAWSSDHRRPKCRGDGNGGSSGDGYSVFRLRRAAFVVGPTRANRGTDEVEKSAKFPVAHISCRMTRVRQRTAE